MVYYLIWKLGRGKHLGKKILYIFNKDLINCNNKIKLFIFFLIHLFMMFLIEVISF